VALIAPHSDVIITQDRIGYSRYATKYYFSKYVENFRIFVIPLLGNGISSVTKGISSFEICYFLDYDGITMAKHGALCK
jgi:hypothetical protein